MLLLTTRTVRQQPLIFMFTLSLLLSTGMVGNMLAPQVRAQVHDDLSKKNPALNFTSLQSAGISSNNFTVNYVKSLPTNLTSDQLKKMQFGVQDSS